MDATAPSKIQQPLIVHKLSVEHRLRSDLLFDRARQLYFVSKLRERRVTRESSRWVHDRKPAGFEL